MNVSSNDTCMVLSVYTDFPIPVTGVLLSLAPGVCMYNVHHRRMHYFIGKQERTSHNHSCQLL